MSVPRRHTRSTRTVPSPDPELFPTDAAPERENAPESASKAVCDASASKQTGTPDAAPEPADDLEPLFARLARSEFRSRFRLRAAERAYVAAKGLAAIRGHAADFVHTRLAPAFPPNDGRQTPMRGHPVFVAQHATGCCCRGCLGKWHGIPAGRPLTAEEEAYVVRVLMAWIVRQMERV